EIYQQLTLRRDGSNQIEITRPMNDPDMPMGGGWHPTKNKQTGMIVYSKTDLVEAGKAKRLFTQAIDAGLLDLQDAAPEQGLVLRIEYAIGDDSATRTGPAFVGRAYHWL